jgi:hypothetical protein
MDQSCQVKLAKPKRYTRPSWAERDAHRRVKEWNESVKSGDPVCVHRDNGQIAKTNTTSTAWVMCGTAVVLVAGISGAYALSHVHLYKGSNS